MADDYGPYDTEECPVAQAKISELPEAEQLSGNELLEIVQDGENRKATSSSFRLSDEDWAGWGSKGIELTDADDLDSVRRTGNYYYLSSFPDHIPEQEAGRLLVTGQDGAAEASNQWLAQEWIGLSSGSVFRRVHNPTNGWGAWERADLILLNSMTVRIPTDFATLQGAVDELSRYRPVQGATITVLIESGAQIDRGLVVRDGNYAHFVISSEDSPLVLPSNYQGHFVYANNAAAPVLNCLVDMGNVPKNNARAADEAVDPESDPFPRNGYHIDENSSGKVNPGCGFIGIAGRRGISAFRGSKVECEGAIANGGPHIGIVAARGSQISAQGATATGNAGRGVYSARSSTLNFHQGNANNNGLHGIVARRTSIINASLATANNCGGSGIFAEHAATVVALEAEAKGCNIGIEALDASIVDAHEIDISDSAMQAILALGASTVNAEACTGTNCGSGLSGDGGVVTSLGASRVSVGRIRTQAGFLNSDLSGAQYNVLWAGQGSTINASNADLSGANGLAAYATQVSTVNARLTDASSTQGFEVARGSFITVSGAVGRENISQTANTVTGDGIIFDENA